MTSSNQPSNPPIFHLPSSNLPIFQSSNLRVLDWYLPYIQGGKPTVSNPLGRLWWLWSASYCGTWWIVQNTAWNLKILGFIYAYVVAYHQAIAAKPRMNRYSVLCTYLRTPKGARFPLHTLPYHTIYICTLGTLAPMLYGLRPDPTKGTANYHAWCLRLQFFLLLRLISTVPTGRLFLLMHTVLRNYLLPTLPYCKKPRRISRRRWFGNASKASWCVPYSCLNLPKLLAPVSCLRSAICCRR